MILEYSDLIHSLNEEILIAPGEADAELAYLVSIDYIDAVISEDSDLVPFGCKKLITKLKHNGT